MVYGAVVRFEKTTLVWFRNDLRLADNPALADAIEDGGAVIPVFLWTPKEEAPWAPGAASRWWLHHSLLALEEALRRRGSRLVLRRGRALEELLGLAVETGARRVVWNWRYEPALLARDAALLGALREAGIESEIHNGALLRDPRAIRNKSGKPFQVFTPFWRHCLALAAPAPPLAAPDRITAPRRRPGSLSLAELELAPVINWDAGLRAAWQPGEAGAEARLDRFKTEAVAGYAADRERPALEGTSRLSPHLHFGEISPRRVWRALEGVAGENSPGKGGREKFLAELGWREFGYHLLFHFPTTPHRPLREEFERFPWHDHPAWLRAWQRGMTGYPLVDAGMRQLWHTGWMHNRVRMVAASFLVKHLRISWTAGARWFWDTLVDADLAANTLGWQWSAGCGADAAPYFRVFNPVAQGERFDPQGVYVRKWAPELAALPEEWIHQPWKAPAAVLARAGVELGRDYPEPIVNHVTAREAALEAFAQFKNH